MTSKEFQHRRRKLMSKMGQNAIAIVPTSPVCRRNNDVEYPFRPDSNFFYLTGFAEPESVAVLRPNQPEGEFILFCRERDPAKEIWQGLRAGLEGAVDLFGAQQAFPIGELDQRILQMMDGRQEIYYAIGAHAELDQKIPCWIKAISSNARSGAQPPHAILSIEPLLHQMRLIKRAAEIRLMKRAANITADAHRHLMQKCRPGLAEYQLEGEFLYHCVQQGAREQAYPPIVASGVNACVLHYTGNSNILQDGDLLLIDAGCEYGYYASDVTRTIPINGRFSPEQRALYQLVLKAQYAAIAQICPGRRFNAAHDAAVEVLTQGLIKLKLLKGPTSKQIQKEGYKKYYMHKSSHWLGMDVHDVGSYKKHQQWCKLRPGMVLTIEPGIYIPPDDSSVPPQWRGIGIRIEDDLLVTPDGHEVLTKNAPKEIDEIEALMAHE